MKALPDEEGIETARSVGDSDCAAGMKALPDEVSVITCFDVALITIVEGPDQH